MRFLKKIIKKTFRNSFNIIEWVVHTPHSILWHFSPYRGDISYGAQLKVRDNQKAVLVNKGKLADIYNPGEYELTSQCMPILSTLKGWNYDFNSQFKIDVYFVNTKHFMNMEWITSNPIMLNDPEFGPIRISAYGSYCFRVNDNPIVFIRNVAGKGANFTTESITEQLRQFIIKKFTTYLAKSKISAHDLSGNLTDFSTELTKALKKDFIGFGIELTNFVVEKVTFPESVEAVLNKDTNRVMIGNMATYTLMQFEESLKKAAYSPIIGGSNN